MGTTYSGCRCRAIEYPKSVRLFEQQAIDCEASNYELASSLP